MTETSTAQNQAALTEAYHVVYDAKENSPAKSRAFVIAAEACQKIADLMAALDLAVPDRYDGEGR